MGHFQVWYSRPGRPVLAEEFGSASDARDFAEAMNAAGYRVTVLDMNDPFGS